MAEPSGKSGVTERMGDLVLAAEFLSRLPFPSFLPKTGHEQFSRCVWAFPLAALIISLPAIGAAVLATLLDMPDLVVVALILVTQIWVTGALHEDGLADVADGFGGGRTAERKLTIMKDSSVGAYALVAIILSLILRVAALYTFLEISLVHCILAFLAAQTLSRGLMALFWSSLPAARNNSLSRSLGRPTKTAGWTSALIGITLSLLLAALTFDLLPMLFATLLVATTFILFRQMCWRHIRGQTGDTIGATQMICEIAFLIGLTTFQS